MYSTRTPSVPPPVGDSYIMSKSTLFELSVIFPPGNQGELIAEREKQQDQHPVQVVDQA